MGRSKFPGKPSKHVNKKRVNVLLCTTNANDEDLNSCCESDEPLTLADEHDVKDGRKMDSGSAKKMARLQQSQNTSDYMRTFFYKYSNFFVKNDALTKLKDKPVKHTKRLIKKQQELSGECRKTLYTKKRLKSDKQNDREQNLVGKFVLPSRSLHSSRVIIPNKRFINHEQSSSSADGGTTTNRPNNRKSKLDLKRPKKSKPEHHISSNAILETSSSDMVLIDSPSKFPSCSKLVLRKARLQLHTKTSEGMDGPFSSYSNNAQTATNPPGTVTCGVCGAVRFYRFVKQARKFNIYSCESCRKFISKMIKRQTCAKNCTVPTLMCHKGQGMCHVPPIVRSQQWKLIRCAYKARCPACWLKMCLRSFQMPSQLKTNLTNMLPENMRSYIDYTSTILSSELQQRKTLNVTLQQLSKKPEKVAESSTNISNNNVVLPKKIDHLLCSETERILNKEKKHIKSRLRVWKKSEVVTSHQTSVNIVRRQKLDLKGPRVKHVCRSASIVLGQPIATFSNENSDDVTETKSDVDEDDYVTCNTCPKKQSNTNEKKERRDPITDDSVTSNVCSNQPQKKSTKNNEVTNEPQVQNKQSKTLQEPVLTISGDYDRYFEEKELNNGFELITSESLPIKAVCFNCGSAEKEQLIYCACCCEPYHYYCLNNNFVNRNMTNDINTDSSISSPFDTCWKLLWTCPRCAVCSQCGSGENQKFVCQLCRQYYHDDCTNPSKHLDGPMVCPSCLSCSTCGSKSNLTKFICNLLLCAPCFKVRKRKNVCTICQKCDDENSESKLIECRKCKNIVHVECEELSDEMYKMFCYLPVSFTFVCRLCSKKAATNLKDTLNRTLQNGYHIILRLLSYNSVAKKLFKWNLTKSRTCTCKFDSDYKQTPFVNNRENVRNMKSKYSDGSDETSEDSDNGFSVAMKNMHKKFSIKECSVRISSCNLIKANDMNDDDIVIDNSEIESTCDKHEVASGLYLLRIKRKIDTNLYKTVKEFHQELEFVLQKSFYNELSAILYTIIRDIFPWYSTEESNVVIQNMYHANGITDSSSKEILKKKLCELPADKCVYDDVTVEDTRKCVLCTGAGDRAASSEGRLLYVSCTEWIHINCAYWSKNVYEEIDSSLQNVHETIAQSYDQFCTVCKQNGATLQCYFQSCDKIYHFGCGRSANCFFFTNKTTYCSQHGELKLRKSTIATRTDFELQRPVYIEPDRQNVKEVDFVKVQFFIGSLNVKSLGTFFPQLSDTEEAIIPLEFVCSRLFWSTLEPWKIVKYTITSSVHVPVKVSDNAEKNFTVDHSFCRDEIEEKIIEIYEWKKDLDCMTDMKRNEDETDDTNVEKVASQVLEQILEVICNKEVEDNCDDEPQNTADILPPELKDAIFEDLPHDLLDGISMQDILPKLMSYEDVLSMDLKNSETSDVSNSSKDQKSDLDIYMDVNNDFSQLKGRKSDLNGDGDIWLEPKYSIHGLDEYIQTGKLTRSNEPELKLNRNRSNQRSCSLTWRCKLDNNSLTSNIKKRKIACTPKSVADISNNLFMVVDGTDKSGMLQELRLPDGVLMTVGRSTNGDYGEFKYRLEENSDKLKTQTQELEQGKENKCKIWQNRSQSRIVQVDGADDFSSSDESVCSTYNVNFKAKPHFRLKTKWNKLSRIMQIDGADDLSNSDNENDSVEGFDNTRLMTINKDEPVKCERCQCTYRTHKSYKKHLETCDFITSESDSDIEKTNDNSFQLNDNKIESCIEIESKELIQSEDVTTLIDNDTNTNIGVIQASSSNITNWSSYEEQVSVSITETVQIKKIESQVLNGSNVFTKPSIMEVSNVSETATPFVPNLQVNIKNAIVPSNKCMPEIKKQIVRKQKTIRSRSNVRNRNKSESVPAKKTRVDNKTVYVLTQPLNYVNQPTAMPLTEVQNNSNGPMLIIQHLPSPNLMPVYVDAFQQQTGQNLQCIATITPNDYKPPTQYVTPQIASTPFQIQPTEPASIVDLQNGNLAVYPSLQPQPTIMGTLIQQRPTVPCGMITAEQMMLGSLPTMNTVMTDVSGSMYLTAAQPMYYGFETVVQNTVMSSQQFISTVPGVLSNSSYSATTTQVFQASKVESLADNSGYILVNQSLPQFTTPNYTLAPIQNNPPTIVASQPLIPEPPAAAFPPQIISVANPPVPTIEPPVVYSAPVTLEQTVPCEIVNLPPVVLPNQLSKVGKVEKVASLTPPAKILPAPSSVTSSISLPVAPYASENGIPLNVVNPIPQVIPTSTATQVSRPMNRVLPMQAAPPQRDFKSTRSPNKNVIHQTTNNKLLALEPPSILNKLSETVGKIQETLSNDVEVLQSAKLNTNENQLLKLESASLKLVFQKQSQDGIYKISNKFVSKTNAPVITPMKQMKPKMIETIINVKNSVKEEKQKNARKSSENTPHILYKIHSQDGFDYSSTSITELWKKVFEAVQSARAAHNMPLLPENALNTINDLQLLGLQSNGLRYLIEQLPGADKCIKYKPACRKEFKILQSNDDLKENEIFRAVRCEPHHYNKESYDMFSWLASRHRNPNYEVLKMDSETASRRAASVNLPLAMRFRQLKETSKEAVGVYRSNIHGRGLFCLRDIESGEMVIEYAGEVIRSTLTDKREKYYNSKGIGCYMFRVDDNLVVDATMRGNAARFINHSCDPNCYSKVSEILGHKHILIYALRKIIKGEELTYDYKFPFEEDKIPCTCGSKRCRKYLN